LVYGENEKKTNFSNVRKNYFNQFRSTGKCCIEVSAGKMETAGASTEQQQQQTSDVAASANPKKVQQRVKQLRTEAEAETDKGGDEALRKALALYAEALALVLPPLPQADAATAASEDYEEPIPPPTPAAAPLFGGRSTVLVKMEQPEAALLDACYAVSHDPRYAKVPPLLSLLPPPPSSIFNSFHFPQI
jgi:hypothetical protein